jgi:hypothetical protein
MKNMIFVVLAFLSLNSYSENPSTQPEFVEELQIEAGAIRKKPKLGLPVKAVQKVSPDVLSEGEMAFRQWARTAENPRRVFRN